MRKFLTAALAALTFGGAVAATAAPAEARPHGYHGGYYGGHRYYGRHHDNDAGVAIAAGVVGLALGAALASDSGSRGYYDRGYRGGYGYSSYYDPGYGYYDDGYRVCESRRMVWDPYIHRRVMVRSTYRC
jgi:hypothetical protein